MWNHVLPSCSRNWVSVVPATADAGPPRAAGPVWACRSVRPVLNALERQEGSGRTRNKRAEDGQTGL
jgi:hypothetical protein